MVAAMLGDLGADVIKVEPPQGDGLRQFGPIVDGHSLGWAAVGRNKRSVTLNLKTGRGQQLLERLLERSDLLVENLPRRTLERWGLDWDGLHARHPRLIVVSISAFGRSGPYADRPGNGTLAEAFAGLTHMTGDADGPPLLTSLPIGDVLAAIAGTLGALAAAYARDANGATGQLVDVSMYEPVLQFLTNGVTQYARTGQADSRSGSRIRGAVPRNTYRTGDDSWIVISAVTDGLVERLFEAMGRSDGDWRARWGTVAQRRADEDALDAEVARWVASLPRDDALACLVEAGIPAAPVNDVADLAADPHVRERGSLVKVEDPVLGPLQLVGPIAQLRGTPARTRSTGPALGAHSDEVLGGELGLTPAELRELREQGVV